jgi:hypothetical protein
MIPPRPLFGAWWKGLREDLNPLNLRATLNKYSRFVSVLAVLFLLALGYFWWKSLFAPPSFSLPLPDQCPLHYITAMISDGRGGAWVAGEDSGIYHYQPSQPASAWKHYDKANSPGLVSNHIYSLCLDSKGRLWAGTLRHGVCVFNGNKWKHYGLLHGPLGSHVVAIAVNPRDQSVWLCTEAGISIYQTGKHTWRYIPIAPTSPELSERTTSANGLPPGPDCVAFGRYGLAFVGTQCHGLAFAAYPYRKWWIIRGPWQIPIKPYGRGLPSSLINAVLADQKTGRIYVATDEGLAWSSLRKPGLFHYVRGADYALKDRRLWRPPHHVPAAPAADLLLPGDHITCLAQDSRGRLWLGTWRNGCWTGIFRVNKSKGSMPEVLPVSRHGGSLFSSSYITAILPRSDGKTLIGHYGTGVSAVRISKPPWWSRWLSGFHYVLGGFHDVLAWLSWRANLPAPAQAPTVSGLAGLCRKLLAHRVSARATGPRLVPITSDWRTQGSWLGRYGRYWACLFACIYPPMDYVWSPRSVELDHHEAIGPHHRKNDYVRFHITWLYTAKKRVLELPGIFMDSRIIMYKTTSWKKDRREAEVNDNGWTYPLTWQGPDLYEYLHIPPGEYTLSLYFFNKDGHSGSNRNCDYVLSLIPLPKSYHFIIFNPRRVNTASLADMRGAVQSRVVNFWGGVWKRFLVRGPMKLAIRVARNYSLIAILSGAMLDPLAEHPAPYYFGHRAWQAHEKQRAEFRTRLVAAWHNHTIARYGSVGRPDVTGGQTWAIKTAQRILDILNVLEHRNPAAWSANQRQAYLSVLRWCVAKYGKLPKNPAAAVIAQKCYYHLGMFHRWEAVEKAHGILTSRQIEKGLRWKEWHKTAGKYEYSIQNRKGQWTVLHDFYPGHAFGVIRQYVKRLKMDLKHSRRTAMAK